MENKITIGHLAKQANVNVETIRYYQRLNIVEKPPKPTKGFRLYPQSLIGIIKFIKRAQKLTFTLAEIKKILQLGNRDCNKIKYLAKSKRDAVQVKIEELIAARDELDCLIDACEASEHTTSCALILSLTENNI